jgi:hypothetical protein
LKVFSFTTLAVYAQINIKKVAKRRQLSSVPFKGLIRFSGDDVADLLLPEGFSSGEAI